MLLLGFLAGAPPAQAQAQDLINQMRGLKDRYSGWRPPADNEARAPRVDTVEEAWARKMAAQNQAEAERVEKQQKQFKALYTQGNEAFRQRNYGEAWQHYEMLRIEYRNAGIFSPQLKDDMERVEAYQAWGAATTAAQFRAAIDRRPSFFSADNLRHVELMEARERYQREQPQREAVARAALVKVSVVIANLAASVGTTPPKGRVLVGDAKTGHLARDTMFGGFKAHPDDPLNDGTSDEHAAIEHGLGFDTFGRLKGEMAAPPAVPPPVAVGIPERVRANPEFQRLPEVIKLQEYEKQAADASRAAVVARARFEEKKAADPAAGDLLLLNARAKDAESRATDAKNMATVQAEEVKRTVSFAAFDVDPPANKPAPP